MGIHQYKCSRQQMQKKLLETKKSLRVSYKLEQLQFGWVVCLRCQKTFLSMTNAKCHYKDEHVDKIGVVANKNTSQPAELNNDEELDTDPDFGLAPLDDGRVICLRCTILCSNIIQAKHHYREQHMTKKPEANV